MKKPDRKLSLSRETLRRIEPDSLHPVAGGSVIDHTVYYPPRPPEPNPILV